MIKIDIENARVTLEENGESIVHPLASPEAFAVISRAWLRCGWDTKYVYGFTWMGRPIIQLPEDIVRIQETVYAVKPDVIVETGIAHGGSLILYASLCKAMGRGRVIGVDIEIRPHNRAAVEAHELFPLITLIEGSSLAHEIVTQVKGMLAPGERCLVVLDSNHSKDHVLAELEAYAPMVSVGSYVIVCDGIMAEVAGGPRTKPDWTWNNPTEAVKAFAAKRSEFVIETPTPSFNEGMINQPVTYCPGGWLRRVR